MTQAEFQAQTLQALARIETGLRALCKAFDAHEQRDDQRFAGLGSAVDGLRSADESARTQALTDARAQIALGSTRRHDWLRGAGLIMIGAAVSAAVAMLMRAM